ncbi:MAG: MFS transporter [Rhodobacteraceae bacterium]|nr:MFS transporter [Paracoccaceae bacterium]
MTTINKRIWGWMFFDWASQPFSTLLITFIFAPYFISGVMSDSVLAQEYWGWMMAISGAILAISAPILGIIVDNHSTKNPFMVVFSACIIVGSLFLWTAEPNANHIFWILAFFGLALVGVEFATIITNSMLPNLGLIKDVGRISGSGWAFGYIGGIIALAIMLLLFAESETGRTLINIEPLFGLNPEEREGTRFVGPFCALWYTIFIIPFFLWTKADDKEGIKNKAKHAKMGIKTPMWKLFKNDLGTLYTLFTSLGSQRSLAAYLLSSMFYRDALAGIFAFGGIYAAGVLGWSVTQLGLFGILALVFGAIAAWVGGYFDSRVGPKAVIAVSIGVLVLVCFIIISTSLEEVLFIPIAEGSPLPHVVFWICGCMIGASGGSLQSSSRTMMVLQARGERYTEAFGLYALAGKATSFLAPFLIALATSYTGDQRLGISPVIFLALIGLILLIWVNKNGDKE